MECFRDFLIMMGTSYLLSYNMLPDNIVLYLTSNFHITILCFV